PLQCCDPEKTPLRGFVQRSHASDFTANCDTTCKPSRTPEPSRIQRWIGFLMIALLLSGRSPSVLISEAGRLLLRPVGPSLMPYHQALEIRRPNPRLPASTTGSSGHSDQDLQQ